METDKCSAHLNKAQAVTKPQNKKLCQSVIKGVSSKLSHYC